MIIRPHKINYSLDDSIHQSIAGKSLVAMPHVSLTPMFAESVIYIASHNKDGAIGFIINRIAHNQVMIEPNTEIDKDVEKFKGINIDMLFGGPVNQSRGFILHTRDYITEPILNVDINIALSSSTKVIMDIIDGKGPSKSLFIVGYTAWASMQLEEEIKNNYWIICETYNDIIFDKDYESKWHRYLNRSGIEYKTWSSNFGVA